MKNSPFEIKTTRINDRYHARLYRDKVLVDEMACRLSVDIGYICRVMLRWQDKAGEGDSFTHSARIRLNQNKGPVGQIWYLPELESSKNKRKLLKDNLCVPA